MGTFGDRAGTSARREQKRDRQPARSLVREPHGPSETPPMGTKAALSPSGLPLNAGARSMRSEGRASGHRPSGGLRYERYLTRYERQYSPLFVDRLSVRHAEYARLEGAFYFAQRSPKDWDEFLEQGQFLGPALPLDEHGEQEALGLLNSYAQAAACHLEQLGDLTRALADERKADNAVTKAVEKLGLLALRETTAVWSEAASAEEQSHLSELRRRVWQRIERWYWTSRLGPRDARTRAVDLLRRTFDGLVPDLRGQRKANIGDQAAVDERYCRKLFRLLRALRLLREWPWRGSIGEKVGAVAAACGLAERELRAYLKLDRSDRLRGAPGSPEQAAYEWVAAELGIHWKTVAKIHASQSARRLLPALGHLSPK